ncbi:recombinase family protein [Hymenobacter sp. B81]|uniref:recombinase family protein n=1 Tax=Hymenobacter sp. B81 TaxID=3344878 RepID=UPI0037DDBCA1
MKVALYARVSTLDKDQNPENQLRVLRQAAEQASDEVVAEYVDFDSGRKSDRAQFQQMLKDAGKRRFQLVRVWDLSRFTREGIQKVFEHLSTLDQCGVGFWSYSEPMLNTVGPMRDLFRALFGWAGAYHSERTSENVKIGLANKKAKAAAKGETYVHGRRALEQARIEELHALQVDGLSVRKIALAMGLGVGTVQNYKLSEEELQQRRALQAA